MAKIAPPSAARGLLLAWRHLPVLRMFVFSLAAIFSVLAVVHFLFPSRAYADLQGDGFRDFTNSVIDSDINLEAVEFFDDMRPFISLGQSEHYNLYGRYWQGKKTFDGLPPLGLESADYRNVITGERMDWIEFGLRPPEFTRFSLESHVYDSPTGHGYVIIIRAQNSDGAPFRKSYNYGSETWRTTGWVLDIPLEL